MNAKELTDKWLGTSTAGHLGEHHLPVYMYNYMYAWRLMSTTQLGMLLRNSGPNGCGCSLGRL